MNVRDNKGSVTLFVLVGLLFMTMFLIISYASNVNKSKISKEQLNMISSTYSHNDSDADSYNRAYTAIRKQNKTTLQASVQNSNKLQLTKTFEEPVSNYRIYGNSISTENVGDLVTNTSNSNYGKYKIPVQVSGKNLFNANLIYYDTSNKLCFSAENLEIGKQYTISSDIPLTWFKISNNYWGYSSVEEYPKEKNTFTFTMSKNANIAEGATQYIYIELNGTTDINEIRKVNIQIEEGTQATEYVPYLETQTYNIYLDEPLKSGEYIDYETQMLVKSNGTKKNIYVPELSTNEDYTVISVLTKTRPSKIEIEYVGYTLQ